MKLAVLSNINADFIAKQLKTDYEVCPTIGYGMVWEPFLDKNSAFRQFAPNVVVFLMDICQLLDGQTELARAKAIIDDWFSLLDQCAEDTMTCFVSDATWSSFAVADLDEFVVEDILSYWNKALRKRLEQRTNLHRLPLCQLIKKIGADHIYDSKLWYMGKIPYTYNGNTEIARMIHKTVERIQRTPKKLLLLDLDNTLWGGILGEDGIDGIALSDDKSGAVYRDVQRKVKQMQQRGVLLAVVSKNNLSDVEQVWREHPYMILKKDDFVSLRINWTDKAQNIREIAGELNLGMSSFVFVDDMPNERENIRMQLPEVIVPDFPAQTEQLPVFFDEIFCTYFQKGRMTEEDAVKTQQYHDQAERERSRQGVDFETFLRSLKLRAERVKLGEREKERVVQLINKTNQFNLTTRRYTRQELEAKLAEGWEVYAYKVADRFGDYGLVAVIMVDMKESRIDNFVMSCRVMGKRVENYLLEQVEADMKEKGKTTLYGEYIPTAKNIPVRDFFADAGYREVSKEQETIRYKLILSENPVRLHTVNSDEK